MKVYNSIITRGKSTFTARREDRVFEGVGKLGGEALLKRGVESLGK